MTSTAHQIEDESLVVTDGPFVETKDYAVGVPVVTGNPLALHASSPPASGRTRVKPRALSALATVAAEASLGQSQ